MKLTIGDWFFGRDVKDIRMKEIVGHGYVHMLIIYDDGEIHKYGSLINDHEWVMHSPTLKNISGRLCKKLTRLYKEQLEKEQ